jgi:hypothetical protein
MRRSSELSVVFDNQGKYDDASIACATNSSLLLTSNQKISWRQFSVWNYRFLGY